MSDFDTLNAQGLAERGDLLGDVWEAPGPVQPVTPPRLPDAPEFPTPGIYFGMPEETYHAIHACSTSGLKKLSVSSMDYWADSVLNPTRDEDKVQKDYFDFGHAIHTLVLEGEEAYAARYVIGLEKPEGVLETTDQIKARIVELGSKPTAKGYDDNSRSAKKEDWIEQLLDLDPEAQIWDRMKAEFEAQHAGAEVISHQIDRRVRIAAKMILAHPEIASFFRCGHAEVSVFWHCPVTGCPMKARFDYLKLEEIVDLKSFGNKGGKPIDRAIEHTIATYRYNMQHVVYDEAVEAAKALVREHGEAAINHCDLDVNRDQIDTDARDGWCHEWAKQEAPPTFVFVFQQTGLAPVTRGKRMPRETMGVFGTTKRRIEELKRVFIANCEVYGTEPWLDIQPVTDIDDEAIPMWATEI